MKIGSKVYYDKATGNVIQVIGQRSGDVVETTTEHEFSVYVALAERVPDTVGMIQLEYGAYDVDKAEGGIITRVNLETLEPLFTYPNPIDPEGPQEPQPALSKQVETLSQESTLLKAQSNALSERADFVEDVIAEMATQVYK